MKEKTLVQKWVDAMKATRGKYIAWMRNVSMREVIGYDIGVISKCAMCKLSTELTGHIVIDGYCEVCPVAVGNGTVKCVESCCYPHGKLTLKSVKIRKRYYDSILAAVKAEKCIDFNRLREIVLEVEAKFKNELSVCNQKLSTMLPNQFAKVYDHLNGEQHEKIEGIISEYGLSHIFENDFAEAFAALPKNIQERITSIVLEVEAKFKNELNVNKED